MKVVNLSSKVETSLGVTKNCATSTIVHRLSSRRSLQDPSQQLNESRAAIDRWSPGFGVANVLPLSMHSLRPMSDPSVAPHLKFTSDMHLKLGRRPRGESRGLLSCDRLRYSCISTLLSVWVSNSGHILTSPQVHPWRSTVSACSSCINTATSTHARAACRHLGLTFCA